MLGVESNQQYLLRRDGDRLLELVIESFDAHAVIHLQAQLVITGRYLGAVEDVDATVTEQTRRRQRHAVNGFAIEFGFYDDR